MTTNIEKQSLEAHVELCAERYATLNNKLQDLDKRTTKIESMLAEIKERIFSVKNESNKRYLAWATGIIGFLAAIIIGISGHYINKLEKTIEAVNAVQSSNQSK